MKKYEYRTLYSTKWTLAATSGATAGGLKDYDFDNATLAGTTIVVRSAAISGFTKGGTGSTNVNSDSDVPAGTEVKVKISAVAKAPKVKVDYAKGIITLPKGVEAMLDTGSKYAEVTGKISPLDLLKELGQDDATSKTTMASGFNLIVRTAAVDGKKAASNITIITLNPSAVLEATNNKTSIDTSNASVTITDKSTSATLQLSEKKNGSTAVPEKLTLTYTPATDKPDSKFIYSIDNGKSWQKLTFTENGGKKMAEIDMKDNAKFKISVEPAENTFVPTPIEVTYKATPTT
ncbi:MAG: hypothetical protein K2N63_16645 [Lachnospiraceae bacterium]|nr:hypothetical protein [Lachnospiraceae bacterium]